MIGTRAALSAGVGLVGLVLVLGPRTSDPGVDLAARQLVHARAGAATVALDALRATLQPGLDEARRAAAAVLSADDPPGPLLSTAGETIAAAEGAAGAARRALASMNGAWRTWRPGSEPVEEPIPVGELTSIGAQLGAVAPAGDAFADLRRRGTALPATLEGALTELEAGNVDAAGEVVARARADHDLVAAWEGPPTTLAVWIETTDAMIRAMETIVSATGEGDSAAASAAAAAFADLSEDAAFADRALRIAIGEGGSALTAAPLERLASALGAVEGARAQAAAIAAATDR